MAALMFVLVGSISTSLADTKLYLENFSFSSAGETKKVAVCLDTDESTIYSVAMTLTMPTGMQLVADGINIKTELVGSRTGALTMESAISNGKIMFSDLLRTSAIEAGNGPIFYVFVKDAGFFASANASANINISGVELKRQDKSKVDGVVVTGATVTKNGGIDPATGINVAFAASEVTMAPGETKTIAVNMDNTGKTVQAFQADLVLPSGWTAEVTGPRGNVTYNSTTGRITNYQGISGASGTVLNIALTAPTTFAGSALIKLSGVKATVDYATVNLSDITTTIKVTQDVGEKPTVAFTADEIVVYPGKTGKFEVNMTNSGITVAGFQADLVLPTGWTAAVTGKRGTYTYNANNGRIMNYTGVTGDEGALFEVALTAPANFEGEAVVKLANVKTTINYVGVKLDDISMKVLDKDAAKETALADLKAEITAATTLLGEADKTVEPGLSLNNAIAAAQTAAQTAEADMMVADAAVLAAATETLKGAEEAYAQAVEAAAKAAAETKVAALKTAAEALAVSAEAKAYEAENVQAKVTAAETAIAAVNPAIAAIEAVIAEGKLSTDNKEALATAIATAEQAIADAQTAIQLAEEAYVLQKAADEAAALAAAKQALTDEIAAATTLLGEADKTAEPGLSLNNAIDAAQAVLNNAETTTEQFKSAAETLKAAEDTYAAAVKAAAKMALTDEVVAATTLLGDADKTVEPGKALNEAIAAAKAVLAGEATTEELNAAIETLKAAEATYAQAVAEAAAKAAAEAKVVDLKAAAATLAVSAEAKAYEAENVQAKVADAEQAIADVNTAIAAVEAVIAEGKLATDNAEALATAIATAEAKIAAAQTAIQLAEEAYVMQKAADDAEAAAKAAAETKVGELKTAAEALAVSAEAKAYEAENVQAKVAAAETAIAAVNPAIAAVEAVIAEGKLSTDNKEALATAIAAAEAKIADAQTAINLAQEAYVMQKAADEAAAAEAAAKTAAETKLADLKTAAAALAVSAEAKAYEAENVQAKVADAEQAIADANTAIAAVEAVIAEGKLATDNKEALATAIADAEAKIAAAQTAINLAQEAYVIQKAIDEAADAEAAAKTVAETKLAELKTAAEALAISEEAKAYEAENVQAKVADAEQAIADANTAIAAVETVIAEGKLATDNKEALATAIATAEQAIADAQTAIQLAEEAYVMQKAADEAAAALAAAKTALEEAITAAKAAETEGMTEASVQALNDAIAAAEAALAAETATVESLNAAKADLEAAVAGLKVNYFAFDGVAYIIDTESGKFVAAGHDWGTRGIVNEIGLDLTFATDPETKMVTIDSRVANNATNHFLGSNLYMDAAAAKWGLLEQDFGFYITDGTQYLSVGADDNLVLSAEPHLWLIVTPEGVKAQRLEDMAAATEENPVDATWMIKAANFNRNDARNAEGWTVSEDCTNKNLSGGNNVNNCAESWHSTFTISQTIEGVPNGVYQLTAQGFWRQDGENEAVPVFFINDQTTVFPVKEGTENSMADASNSFTEGLYTIDPMQVIVEDGIITLGVKNETNTTIWCIWDNFRLTYLGPDMTALNNAKAELQAAIETAKAADTEGMTDASVQALNDAIAAAEAALAAQDATVESLTAALNDLNAAVAGLTPKPVPVFADGTYYLYNAAIGQYMGAGSSWGTHAVTNAAGLDYTLAFTEDGKYTIDSQVSNGGNSHFLNGEWNDGAAMGWIFAPVEGAEGVYTISNGESFLTAQGENGEVLLQGDATAAAAQWILKTKEDRLAELAAATKDAPVNATFLVADGNFNRNDLRKAAWTGDDFSVGGDNTNMNAEKWGGNSQLFDIKQTIELPNGVYKVTWNGYYRYNNTTENTNDVAAAAHAEGTEVINSFVYLNDTDYALTSIADEAAVEAFGKMPFSQGDASAAFGQGLYEQTAEVTVEEGTLTIGIKKIEHLGTDWTVWDNFRLAYLGEATVVNPDDDVVEAPEGWTNLVANGNLAGDLNANYFSKESPSSEIKTAAIVAGAGKNHSRGIVVKSADEAAGADAWNTQFWIKVNQSLPIGTKLHVEFDYAASQAAKASTQSHGENPGQYIIWHCIGDVNFTTEWQHFSTDVEVAADMANMQCIAFNLAEEKTATEYYFDNFGVWAQIPEPVQEWENLIVNSDIEGESMECFYVTEQGVGGPFVAIATEGIGKDGSKAVKVQSADDVTEGGHEAQDWDSQFFIRLPYQLPAGTQYKVSFDYKADKAGGFDTQAHANPGQYIHWAFCGSGNFTTEWQTFEAEGAVPAECDGSSAQKTFQTIAFNLAKNRVATEFVFDNVKFFVPKDIVSSLTKNPDENPVHYPTGIKNVMNEMNAEGIFNLNGQKIQKTQKGLYIKNGKKVVIK